MAVVAVVAEVLYRPRYTKRFLDNEKSALSEIRRAEVQKSTSRRTYRFGNVSLSFAAIANRCPITSGKMRTPESPVNHTLRFSNSVPGMNLPRTYQFTRQIIG